MTWLFCGGTLPQLHIVNINIDFTTAANYPNYYYEKWKRQEELKYKIDVTDC